MRAANSWWLLCCTHRQTCIAQNCSSARPKKARAPSLPTTFRRNCLSLPLLLFSVSVSFRYSCFSFDLFAPLLLPRVLSSSSLAVRFSLFPTRFFLSSSCQGFVASPYLARAIREHRRHERRRYKLESTAELWGSEGGGEERRKDRERRRQSTREGEKRTSLTSLFTVAFQIPRNPAHL